MLRMPIPLNIDVHLLGEAPDAQTRVPVVPVVNPVVPPPTIDAIIDSAVVSPPSQSPKSPQSPQSRHLSYLLKQTEEAVALLNLNQEESAVGAAVSSPSQPVSPFFLLSSLERCC